MSYTIHSYDAEKRRIASQDAPDELEEATDVARTVCARLDDGGEAHVVASVGGGEKWLLGFRMMGGSPARLTPELLKRLADEAKKAAEKPNADA